MKEHLCAILILMSTNEKLDNLPPELPFDHDSLKLILEPIKNKQISYMFAKFIIKMGLEEGEEDIEKSSTWQLV